MLSKIVVLQCCRGWVVGTKVPLVQIGGVPYQPRRVFPPPAPAPQLVPVRYAGELIPPTQYDTPLSKKFKLGYVLGTYWELIPIFVVTLAALSLTVASIIWAINHKVDVVFGSPHTSEKSISRTMDLRKPTTHKIITMTQRYESWPEMQAVLDKMRTAEERALRRTTYCE